jgi:hypothetical protein
MIFGADRLIRPGVRCIAVKWEYLFRRRYRQAVARVHTVDGLEKLSLLRCPFLKLHFADDVLGGKTYRVINLPDFEIIPELKVKITYLACSRVITRVELWL